MADQKKHQTPAQSHAKDAGKQNDTPKTESTSEYEGASSRKPTGNQPVEKKTETSSSSGQ